MPINSKKSVYVLESSIPYSRLAFRCSLKVDLVGDTVGSESTMSLHGTRYRKPVAGKFDVCGLVGEGELRATLFPAVLEDAALMQEIAVACRAYADVAGDCTVSLNFSWRTEQGDLVGMAMLTVTPDGGEPITKSSGDTNTLSVENPEFAATFAAVFAAIDSWCTAKAW